MINGLEGLPRSGKSYEAVVYHILHAVQDSRKVITNLPVNVDMFAAIDPAYRDLIELRTKSQPVLGTWDADRVPAFKLFEDGEKARELNTIVLGPNGQPIIRKRAPLFGQVWDFYTDWKDEKGRGPLFLIDECHIAMPKVGSDPEVEQWMRLHGHFNQDVLLITQGFRRMDQGIAELVAILIKVRKADILGDSDSYIRKVHAGYRGAVLSTEIRKYKPEMFPLYKSHTQGNSVAESSASDVSPFLVKFNRFKYVWLAITAAYCVYAFWPAGAPVAKSQPLPVNVSPGQAHQLKVTATDSTVQQPAPEPPDLDPFKDQKIHLTGWFTMGGQTHYSFVVSSGGQRLFELTQYQIAKAGYTFKALGDCAGLLTFESKVKTVICDAPVMNSGAQNAPILVADGSRRRSDD